MSLYETLKVAKIGAAPDMLTRLRARIAPFANSGSTPTEKELEAAPPLSFKSNGEPLIDWNLNGASGGVGDRTSNLFDEKYDNISTTIIYKPLNVGDGDFTLSTTTPYDSMVANVFLLSGNVSAGASTAGNGAWLNHDVTASAENGYITIAYRVYTNTTSPADCKTILNAGSTASEYEPYGYKIPIICGGETNTIYLDEPLGTSDSIDMTDTGISIPTVDGSNTFSVGTTVQPSNVYIKYKG